MFSTVSYWLTRNVETVLMEAVGSTAQFTYYKNGVSKQIDTSDVCVVKSLWV